MLKPSVEILRQPHENNINHILGYNAVSESGEPIGHVKDYVFDEANKLRYLVIDTGFWIFGKKVLFPVGMAQIREDRQELVLKGLTRDMAEQLPGYQPGEPITDEFETRVFGSYFPQHQNRQVTYGEIEAFQAPIQMRLLEERLMIDKHAEKLGDVKVRKIVETYIETIEVPVTVERLIVEPSDNVEVVTSRGKPARHRGNPKPVSVQEEEVVTIPAYREVVEVSKRKVVAEEVRIRKVTETLTETIEAELQKEELYVDNPIPDR